MHGLVFETSICYWQDQPDSRFHGRTPARKRARFTFSSRYFDGGLARRTVRSADGPTQAKVHASANGTHRLSARAPVSRFPLGISTARRARNQSPSPRPASRCSEAPSPPRVSECGEQFQADLVPRDRDASHRVVQGFGNVKYGAIVARSGVSGVTRAL